MVYVIGKYNGKTIKFPKYFKNAHKCVNFLEDISSDLNDKLASKNWKDYCDYCINSLNELNTKDSLNLEENILWFSALNCLIRLDEIDSKSIIIHLNKCSKCKK
jgi:hypothetical protein